MKTFVNSNSTVFDGFPILSVRKNIKLRELQIPRDIKKYYKLFADPKVSKYLSDENIPFDLEQSSSMVRYWHSIFYKKQSFFWAISRVETDDLIGSMGFNSWSQRNAKADISYDLCSEYWRQGIMFDVLMGALRFGFEKMLLNRVEVYVMKENIPSHLLLKKIGFCREGELREYRIVRGETKDVIVHSLLLKDYNKIIGEKK